MDLSLDDIIKKNKIGNNRQQRGRLQSGPSSRGNTKGNLRRTSQSNGKIIKGARHPLQSKDNSRQQFSKQKNPGVVDARLKIIQKSRQRLTDARDKLSELAKQTDVRSKIKGGRTMAQQPDRMRDRAQGIIQRITTNPSLLQRSIRNNVSRMRDTSSLIRCTINRTDLQPYDEDNNLEMMDIDSPILIRKPNDLNFNNIKMVAQNEYSNYRQDYLPNLTYLENHYEQPVFRQFQSPRQQVQMAGRIGGRMSQEMRARLDTQANPPLQYGFAQEQLSPPAVQGHRIVVSNLHSSVTHEDIKELFEDIGPLLTSRLVRPGTAEVIYKVQKDAKKAVEAYHNRQLDGQPMKCLLVNPRPPAVSSGVLRSNNMAPAPKFPVSSKSMVVPDISAIHKALFTSK